MARTFSFLLVDPHGSVYTAQHTRYFACRAARKANYCYSIWRKRILPTRQKTLLFTWSENQLTRWLLLNVTLKSSARQLNLIHESKIKADVHFEKIIFVHVFFIYSGLCCPYLRFSIIFVAIWISIVSKCQRSFFDFI